MRLSQRCALGGGPERGASRRSRLLCGSSSSSVPAPCGRRSCCAPRRGVAAAARVACRAAASDERSRAEPLYLSDLIAFESDAGADAGGPSSNAGSSLEAALGLAPGDAADGVAPPPAADPTARAQEIISRATEVLAAARAALGNPGSLPDAGADQQLGAAPASGGSSGAERAPYAAAGAGGPSATAVPATPAAAAPSFGAAAPSSAHGPGLSSGAPGAAPAASGDGSSNGGAAAGGGDASEQLTRHWSALSEEQDLTRHVLQNALDQMQRSGAPIAAPKDEPRPPPPPPAGASSSSAGSSPGLGPTLGSSSGSSSGGSSGGGGGSGGSSSRSSSRDIRRGRGSGPGLADSSGPAPAPSWAASLLGSNDFDGPSGGYSFPLGAGGAASPAAAGFAEPQLQLQQAAARPSSLGYAEDEAAPLRLPPAALGLLSQAAMDAERARTAVLPPLQSVIELTTAFKPPERSGGVAAAAPAAAAATAEAVTAPVGRALADGSGRLADGTWWEKKSGIEYGKNGYWKHWQLLKGGNAEGTLEWEETWWEASDWTGLKEMGAQKKGRNTTGDAWRESWSERLMYASDNLDCVVERNAHKWAAEANGDEWEEKWGEHYHAGGKVAKFADKWGKAGPNVWHERWGEDYDASKGDACVKWTDKWAERLLPGGAREEWGDKWHEAFAAGRGEKNGEVWSVAADGSRYQRWWGEQHLGDGHVRRHGHSTTGEQWDDVVGMDTYYNPVPHFGFKLALDHSPQLKAVPLQPKPINEADPFGPGLDAL